MSIWSLILELWQFYFIRDWPEIRILGIPPSEFCPIPADWGKLWIPSLTRMCLIECYWMLLNLFRENQLRRGGGGGGKITTAPSPTQIRVKCLTVRSFKVFNSCNFFQNDIENINPILLKCISTILNRCKVIKKYINYTFSSNQNQLKDKSDVHFFKYHILAAFWQYQK